MTKRNSQDTKPSAKPLEHLAYDLPDKPVVSPRYGGLTMREALIKALKRDRPQINRQDELPDGGLQLGV